ncbi:MAG: hypothetical protein U0T74_07015 [Chitinophagales bacterium]
MKELLLTLLYLLLANLLIFRFKRLQFSAFKPFVTVLIFNIKFLVGILVWMIYTFYYSNYRHSDIHKFYQDALVLNSLAHEHPVSFAKILVNKYDSFSSDATVHMAHWYRNFDESPFNENQTIIKLNALLMFLTLKTYFIHVVFFCFFSLIGWVLLTNAVFYRTGWPASIISLPVMMLPSVLFWTSGILKEPVLVLGLGLTVSAILSGKINWKNAAMLSAGCLIMLHTKFYVLASLIPPIAAFLVCKRDLDVSAIVGKYIAVNAIAFVLAFNIHQFVPGINLQQMLMNKQMNAIKEAMYFKAGSRIDVERVNSDVSSVIKAGLAGIRNVIFRPYVWETENVMMLAGALENVFILFMLILCIWAGVKNNEKQLNLFLFLFNFSLLYFALVGMATPVLGNLVRYKAPVLPFFLYAFSVLVKPEKLPHQLEFLRRKQVV